MCCCRRADAICCNDQVGDDTLTRLQDHSAVFSIERLDNCLAVHLYCVAIAFLGACEVEQGCMQIDPIGCLVHNAELLSVVLVTRGRPNLLQRICVNIADTSSVAHLRFPEVQPEMLKDAATVGRDGDALAYFVSEGRPFVDCDSVASSAKSGRCYQATDAATNYSYLELSGSHVCQSGSVKSSVD